MDDLIKQFFDDLGEYLKRENGYKIACPQAAEALREERDRALAKAKSSFKAAHDALPKMWWMS